MYKKALASASPPYSYAIFWCQPTTAPFAVMTTPMAETALYLGMDVSFAMPIDIHTGIQGIYSCG